ncbi:MAG: hypothetical protein ACYSSO_12025 [Planctomycetota bacterium]
MNSENKNPQEKPANQTATISYFGPNTLKELKSLFINLELPTYEELKECFNQQDLTPPRGIRICPLDLKFADLSKLENALKQIIPEYPRPQYDTNFLKSILSDIEDIKNTIQTAKELRAEIQPDEYENINRNYSYDFLKTLYQKINTLKFELKNNHLQKLDGLLNNAEKSRSSNLSRQLKAVWDLLEGKAMPGKIIASELLNNPRKDNTIAKRISELNDAGCIIKNKRGIGYYRPDAPPPELI